MRRPLGEVVLYHEFPVPPGTLRMSTATISQGFVVITGCKGAGLLTGAFKT